MTPLEFVLFAALVVAIGIFVWELGIRASVAWDVITCEHEHRTRFWFPRHHFVVVCKTCGAKLAKGRDITHRYPDEAPGVRRGARRSA